MRTTTKRSPSRVRSLLAGLVLVLTLGPLGATTPTAHADAIDDEFLAALDAQGIEYASAEAAIIAAHEVCDELDLGRTPTQVAHTVINNSNLDGYHAGYFVGASIAVYCPKYLGQI
jgi:hypothetical protein